jgi:hypothetical protein
VLRRLMDRSLVRVDDEGRLRMHDVLGDMGRDIVKRQARGSEKQMHLWDAATVLKVLSFKKASILKFCFGHPTFCVSRAPLGRRCM